ncbi:hypothetical protein GCM10017774_76820 [Lentzea cavernae]|uniref:DNA-binding protein n=1 Tax=Lentzea cavernae TaxID=2020703 RepID=A0ABQ3MQ49_9PSEU|nr:hypothetical protein GCM10017774_76820 [Lentzea cavernae]
MGCSEWLVNDRARKREIPFTKVGRTHMFSAEQFADIVAIFASTPEVPKARTASAPRRSAPARSQQRPVAESVTRLQPRPPRRQPKAG